MYFRVKLLVGERRATGLEEQEFFFGRGFYSSFEQLVNVLKPAHAVILAKNIFDPKAGPVPMKQLHRLTATEAVARFLAGQLQAQKVWRRSDVDQVGYLDQADVA